MRRKVALKIVKLGMDTKQIVARFEAERQALAMLDHSNIAKLLDAGVTDQGRPYFVMELVRGLPITEHCDTHRLGVDQRVQLFETVCRAVHHAHLEGLVHRDLKPSNIMISVVDDTPVVKLIDFGIAKALGPSLTDRTLHTRHDQIIGTPEYMSPEQAGLDLGEIDARSDVYSLGVRAVRAPGGHAALRAGKRHPPRCALRGAQGSCHSRAQLSSHRHRESRHRRGIPSHVAPTPEDGSPQRSGCHRHDGPGAGASTSLPLGPRLCRGPGPFRPWRAAFRPAGDLGPCGSFVLAVRRKSGAAVRVAAGITLLALGLAQSGVRDRHPREAVLQFDTFQAVGGGLRDYGPGLQRLVIGELGALGGISTVSVDAIVEAYTAGGFSTSSSTARLPRSRTCSASLPGR